MRVLALYDFPRIPSDLTVRGITLEITGSFMWVQTFRGVSE